MPESDLGKTAFHIRDNFQIDLFIGINTGHAEFYSIVRYLSIGVGGSGISETEDIAGRFIRKRKLERAKERFPLAKSFFKSHNGDLSGGAVHLDLVVSMHLMPKYFPYLFHTFDILTGAGPHNVIL